MLVGKSENASGYLCHRVYFQSFVPLLGWYVISFSVYKKRFEKMLWTEGSAG